ncbi:MAG: DUF3387 domain-containing protein [Trueperaceae bacterium]|nr:DUF3387 domain-containing protein [Trueperaceae bacterium]
MRSGDRTTRPRIAPEFEEATEGEGVARKKRLKTKWAQLGAVVGSSKRLARVARDIVEHVESRCEALPGKAMVVCMSRRICVERHREIARLRPAWVSDDDATGAMKVVMTGSASDPLEWQPHVRNKPRREVLADRFRDPTDQLRIVLVRDMWLTGFDAPSLHTMYVDKPMRGHGLMQAIARVNRVLGSKPDGLVVDYLGLVHELKRALATYTESGGRGRTALDRDEAVAVMLEKHEVCCGLFHGFARSAWVAGTPAERLGLLPAAQEHVLAQGNGKERTIRAVRELSRAFSLSVPHDEALRIRDEVGFFQVVELLQKLLHGELAVRRRKNVVQARSFAEMLERTLRKYQNRAIEAAQVIEELIGIARDMRAAADRGVALGLTEDELAVYDVLETNDSALAVLGDATLRDIARELVETVRQNVSIDWTLRENVRAHLRVLVKRILRRHGYPPDKQETATRTVLEQAEVLSGGWVGG